MNARDALQLLCVMFLAERDHNKKVRRVLSGAERCIRHSGLVNGYANCR